MSTKAHQIEPASANGKFDAQGIVNGTVTIPAGWIAEDKKDDLRYLFQVRPNGASHNFITSRRISKKTNEYVEKQDICPLFRNFILPPADANTVIDGGFHGTGISSDVVHQMHEGEADYCAFHILMYRGRDVRTLTQRENKALLHHVISKWQSEHMFARKRMTVTRTIPFFRIRIELDKALKAGREGLMLKDPSAVYGKGWYKAKRKETFDVIITGFLAPDSEIYAKKGWFGQLSIGQKLPDGKIVELGKVKNMTDELRATISANKKAYLYTVLEISAQERLKSGKFRNPSVIMPRPDKSPDMCRFNPSVEA